jgi:hypothetical protein
MADLTVETVARTGLNATYVACSAGGDAVLNTGVDCVLVKNGSGSSITVTVVTQDTVDGNAVADRTVVIPAGEERIIGPFRGGVTYNDVDNKVQLTYSAVTSLTIAALRIPAS